MIKPMDKKIASFYAKIFLYLVLNRGSYTSAYVLLNLLNQLSKRGKMESLPSILLLSQRV